MKTNLQTKCFNICIVIEEGSHSGKTTMLLQEQIVFIQRNFVTSKSERYKSYFTLLLLSESKACSCDELVQLKLDNIENIKSGLPVKMGVEV